MSDPKRAQAIETEVKFHVADLAAIHDELIAQGALITQSRHLERNILFDDDQHTLEQRGAVLRLRSALDATLTLKSLSPSDAQNIEHKVRVEIESVVADFDAMFHILESLGFSPTWRYEKYRESLRLNDAIISLDHTPIGDFVEIEGPPASIRVTADRLSLAWEKRNLQSYRALFHEMASKDQANMVFEKHNA